MLTNLQRGNVQTKTSTSIPERTVHQLAAQGEIFARNIDAIPDLNEADESGLTPLMWASSYGQLSTVKLLLERGACCLKTSLNGETALHFAASNGHIHLVKELLSHGAAVNSFDDVSSKLDCLSCLYIIQLFTPIKGRKYATNVHQ